MLGVFLAGGVRVECDGDAIDDRLLGGRQGRRLLAHMAWEGRSVHRDELADGIWSTVLPRTWERTLSGVVTRLRAGLTEAGVRGEVISYVDGRYCLVGGGEVHLDVAEAAADLVVAQQAADRGDHDRARMLAESVLVVARLPLMPGEDARWADAARARHRTLLFDTLDLLADTALAAQWYALGEAAAREAVHWEPLREAGHQRLLRVLSAKGDRAEALTAYSACRRLLADELGVDPSPETEAIYVGLLGTEPVTADLSRRDVGLATPGPRVPFPSDLQDHVTALVGREPALVWLWSLWRKARPDAPLTAVIHGPAGAGKRSLAAVFAREVYAAGATVVYDARNDDSSAVSPNAGSAPVLAVLDQVEQRTSLSTVRGAALVIVLAPTCAARPRCDAELALAPLDRWSVSAVFEDRLGRPPSAAELDEMCSLTGGWPGAVVAEISLRQDARARALAFDATSAAASLVAANRALADELLRRRPLAPSVSSRAGGSAPYKGLLRFEPEDADLFFGREQLVSDLLAGVSAGRLLAVVGASGSGKSSLVRAGLVAELRRGALPGSDRWPVVLLTPGRHPSASLAACLRAATEASPTAELDELVDRFSRGPPSVVVVDQFEELFTLGADRAEQALFVAALLACVSQEGRECRVVVALRSDFYGACTTNLPALAVALARSQVVVPPPSDVELRRMVALPARAAGVVLESGLVDEVVTDVGDAPGALPLMSTALLEAWGRRINGIVTLDAYRAAGGVRGAISTLAESVWEAFDPTERRLARSMLLRLAGTNDAAEDVGTLVERIELGGLGDVTAAQVLGQLVKRRLVTVDADSARIAHEALLREWPRLRGWLDDDRATRDVLHHLRTAAADWQRRGADRADLYRGTRLVAALDLDSEIELSERERSFLAASMDLRTSEVESLRRRTRRQRALSAGLVVLLVIASIAGVTAVGRQRQATDRARVATAQRLTQQAGSATGLDLRLLLAVEARHLDDSPEARGALLGQLTQANAVTAFLRGGAANLSAVAMSPDGSMLATGGADGAVSLWRLPGDELLRTVPLLDGRVTAVVFSADGELAAGGDSGEVARWTLDGSKPIRFRAHASNVLALAYGSGHSLLTAGDDGLLRAFSVSNGQELWSRSIPVGALAATFDANGSTYVQAQPDRSLSVIEVGGGSSVLAGGRDTNEAVSALALSTNGRRVAFGTSSGIVKVFDRDSGTTSDLGRISSQTTASSLEGVDALVFTPSGEVLATAGGSITRLNPANSDNREPLQLVGGRVTGLAVDPSGETATAVTETGEAVVFALRRPGLGRPLANAGQPVTALTVAQGQLVAAAGDSQVALWDTASDNRRVLPMPGHPVTAIAASGDGTLLAVVGRDVVFNGIQTSTYAVVDANSGRLLVEAAWYPNTVAATAVALQPAGTLLAIGDEQGGQVRVFEARSGRPVRDLNSPAAAIAALAFTPSGQELVGVTTDGVVVRWDTQGRPIGEPIELGSNASALAMAPDGNTIAVATASGALIVDLATGAIGAGLTSPFGRIESVAFGLDGTVLATGGSGRVILWDVPSRRPLGNALPAPGNTAVAFDATGRQLITGGDDGEVIVWPIDPDRWVEMACNLAGRTLTRDEWRRYLGDRAYHPACR